MKIIHIASEMFPFAQVGGLGEVLHGLTQALKRKHHDVSVILPKYSIIPSRLLRKAALFDTLTIEDRGKKYNNKIRLLHYKGIKIFFIEPTEKNYLNRKSIYCYRDDINRFIYFSCVAFTFLYKQNKSIDILHLHDWHVSLIAYLYRTINTNNSFKIKKIVLTLHNLAYQGKCTWKDIARIKINNQKPTNKKYLTHNLEINLLKGGIVCTDEITTVSPSYAQEILTKKFGFNLEGQLRKRKNKLTGIINGIDYNIWDPQHDSRLFTNYSANDPINKIIAAKEDNKRKLCKKLNIKYCSSPLLSNIGRLVQQKGPKLIKHSIICTLKYHGGFILIGSFPPPEIKKEFKKLKYHYSHEPIYIDFNYDEDLVRLIFAASDFIVVPSAFEPCGLTQLIALRYGTIPIVRETGGLQDTVFDINHPCIPSVLKNGFTFSSFSKKEIKETIHRAINFYTNNLEKRKSLISRVMKKNYSWKKPANLYINLYKK